MSSETEMSCSAVLTVESAARHMAETPRRDGAQVRKGGHVASRPRASRVFPHLATITGLGMPDRVVTLALHKDEVLERLREEASGYPHMTSLLIELENIM